MNGLTEKGREGFLDGTIDWDTNTIKAALVDPATADTGIKIITAASNATPIVITATAHGFANGDLVFIDNVGGNLAANGFWKIANQAANTFELTDPITAANAVGSAAYTSGGYAICYGPSAAGDNVDDYNGAFVGTDQTLAGASVTSGVADATDPAWTSVLAGNTIRAMCLYKDTGTPSTSRVAGFLTGKFIVTTAAAASTSATSISVDKLPYGIANGTVLTFSDGKTATLSAIANAGDRTLTVSALASGILVEKRALAPQNGSGFPLPTNGGNVNFTFDNGPNKIFKL